MQEGGGGGGGGGGLTQKHRQTCQLVGSNNKLTQKGYAMESLDILTKLWFVLLNLF